MKLREFINKLEEISMGGKNDSLEVEVFPVDGDRVDGNEICESIKNVWINRYVSPNDEYEYVMIETE